MRGMELGIEITIFREGPPPLRQRPQMWWRRFWRKLPVHRAPREPGGTLFKATFDARMVGAGTGADWLGYGCRHDVCFEEAGGVIAGGLRYLGFTIVPDAIDLDTIIYTEIKEDNTIINTVIQDKQIESA